MVTLKYCGSLREYVPLKQGLRRTATPAGAAVVLREYVPLKQGLRQLLQYEGKEWHISESMFH